MVVSLKPTSLEEFVKYAELPENADRTLEWINGEVIEVSPSRNDHSNIGFIIAGYVTMFCLANNLPLYGTGADGTYLILGHVVVPDVSYKSTFDTSNQYPDPVPPQFAVEIISPTDKPKQIREKRAIYVEAGILYWEIYQDEKIVDVYEPGKPPRALNINGTLDGANVLPGFTLPVKNLFPD